MSESDSFSIADLVGKAIMEHPKPDARWALPTDFIGVEIETERCRINDKARLLAAGWSWHNDASLRNSGVEFTFTKPLSGSNITRAFDTFFGDPAPATYEINPRAGVHIHINWLADGLSLKALRNLIVLMYCIEPAVYEWADTNRKWCGYCCQLTDLPEERLRTLLTSQSKSVLSNALSDDGGNRYWGLNLVALAKFGSVEFRYFPTTDNREDLEAWVNFVMSAKKAACEFNGDYQDLIQLLSTGQGIHDFLATYMTHNNIGTTLFNHLTVNEAVARIKDMGYLVALTPARPARIAVQSKAITKYMSLKFSGRVVTDAASMSELIQQYYSLSTANQRYSDEMIDLLYQSEETP